MSEPLRVYAAACVPEDLGNGGWAWATGEHDFSWNCEKTTSKERMELTAVFKGLFHNIGLGPVTIVTESSYVTSCFKDEWWRNWTPDGFKKHLGEHEAVANWDLWQHVLAISLFGEYEVRYEKIREHDEDPLGELVAEVARMAVNQARKLV